MEKEKAITITPIEVVLTPDLINLYAEVSGDHNRIHLDEDYARTSIFGTRIAHGMLLNAVVSEMLMNTFGQSWAKNGHLDVSFVAPAPLGSVLRTYGEITGLELEPEGYRFSLKVWGEIDNNQKVLTGTGSVLLTSGTDGL